MTNYRNRFNNKDNKSDKLTQLDEQRKNRLFNIDGNKIVVNQTDNTLLSEVESEKYVKNYIKQKNRYIPGIDYNDPSSFAFFGSAQKYYEDSIGHIHESYPYDGSRSEKVDWSLSASLIDLYMLEHEYPKSAGHIDLERSSVSSSGTLYNTYTTPRYISFSGGPQKNTIYNASKNRESNLKIDGTTGNTVEFWLKKDNSSWQADLSREVILDVDTKYNTASVDRGRLTIELQAPSSSAASPFMITYTSGSTGTSTTGDERGLRIGSSTVTKASVADGKWHHYAVSMLSTGSSTIYKLYVDGALNQEVTESHTIGPVVNFTNATIGASNGGAAAIGLGQMSASIDEFRFWKSERDEKQIGDNWYRPVHGGSDKDNSNASLGVYFKFNEGVTNVQADDEIVLDYSGRINNGKIIGWKNTLRSTTSGIELSENLPETDFSEVKDPIINPENSLVQALVTKYRNRGLSHDIQNAGALRNSVPQFFIDQDNGFFKELLQIMASSFDDLFLKVKNLPKMKDYDNSDFFNTKGSYTKQEAELLLGCPEDLQTDFVGSHTKPWVNHILEHYGLVTTEIFANASLTEQFLGRTKDITFEHDLHELKNSILSNIHKNLVNIYKSKGTESSFRNLVRCFGVDDDLIKLNTYANNEEYKIENKPVYRVIKQKSVSFEGLNQTATIYQTSSSSGERDYITGSTNYTPFTLEASVLFPEENDNTTSTLTTTSLFGMHNVKGSESGNNLDWHTNDSGSLQVEFVRRTNNSKEGYFKLSGTDSVFTAITSSHFLDVYDNSHWNVSVRVGAQGDIDFNLQPIPGGANYLVEFTGYNYDLDALQNSFYVTASISKADFEKISQLNKAVYVGAHRTNFSGSVQRASDVRVMSFNYWNDALEESELKEHAQNPSVFGRKNPELVSLFDNGANQSAGDSLALRWQFSSLSSSSGTGTLDIVDFSHGDTTTKPNAITQFKHRGYGFDFVNNDANAIDLELIASVEYFGLDNVYSSDKVKVKETETSVFEVDSRPITHFYSFEKSMYDSISREMISFFAGIKGFNNLIGEPVNKYRQKYKLLESLKHKFFSRVENTVDLEKFVDYYRWIDQSLSHFLNQLVPASAHFGNDISDVVESHILERNKIKYQAPTIEFKDPSEKVFPIVGIRELLYDWEHGHAPLNQFHINSKSILFDGSDDHVLIGDHDDFSFTDGSNDKPFTISAWVYVDDVSSDNGPFVTKALVHSGTGLEYIFKHANGQLRVFLYKGTGTSHRITLETNSVVLTDQTWHHVVFTYSGNKLSSGMALYVDGTQVTSTNTSLNSDPTTAEYTGMTASNTPLIIGKTNNDPAVAGQAFEDRMADVCIFNKQLSSAEASELYNAGSVKNMELHSAYSDLISWWKMGDDLDTAGANGIKDYVRSHHGTLTSGASIVEESATALPSDGPDEQVNCLYFADRRPGSADTEPLRRIANTEVSGSTYALRKLTKPYRFSVDRSQTVKTGFNSKSTKISEAYKILNTGRAATIAASSLIDQDKCRDIINPNENESYSSLINISDTDDYMSLDSNMILPFNLISSSAGYDFSNFKDNLSITNNHLDIHIHGETSLQSPFSRRHVGGMPHRRVELGTAVTDRPEAYTISASATTMVISGAAPDTPKSFIHRDLGVGSNMVIRNIKDSTSGQVLGNYSEEYELVLTNGRTQNDAYFAQNSDSFLNLHLSSSFISGSRSLRARPSRTRKSHVIVNRFSGDHKANESLDPYFEEMSVANVMNYRHTVVRGELDEISKVHAGQFGVISSSLGLLSGSSTHKVNRNPSRFTGSLGQEVNFDNNFVSHPIPQTDYQYSWIAAAASGSVYDFLNSNSNMGHVIGDGVAFGGADADRVSILAEPRYSRILGQQRSVKYMQFFLLNSSKSNLVSLPFFYNQAKPSSYSGGSGTSLSAGIFGPSATYFTGGFSVAIDVGATNIPPSTSASGQVETSLYKVPGSYEIFLITIPGQNARDLISNCTVAIKIGNSSEITAIATKPLSTAGFTNVVITYDNSGGHAGIKMFFDGAQVPTFPVDSEFELTASSPASTTSLLGDPGLAHNAGTITFTRGTLNIRFTGQPTSGQTLTLPASNTAGEVTTKTYTAAASNNFSSNQYGIGSSAAETAQNLRDAILHSSGHNGLIAANYNTGTTDLELQLANLIFGTSNTARYVYGTLIRTAEGVNAGSLRTSSDPVFRSDGGGQIYNNATLIGSYFAQLGGNGGSSSLLAGNDVRYNLYSLALFNKVISEAEREEIQQLKFEQIVERNSTNIYQDYRDLTFSTSLKGYWRFDGLTETTSNVMSVIDEVSNFTLSEDNGTITDSSTYPYVIATDPLVKASVSSVLIDNSTATEEQKLRALGLATGIYGHPSWKQVRNYENPSVRNQRKTNEIGIVTRGDIVFPDSQNSYNWDWYPQGDGNNDDVSRTTDRSVTLYKEVPVTNRFKPLTCYTILNTSIASFDNPKRIGQRTEEILWSQTEKQPLLLWGLSGAYSLNRSTRTHANNISKFANPDLSLKIGIDDTNSISKGLVDTQRDIFDSRPNSVIMTYSETLYPREQNTFIEQTRERTLFDFDSWRDLRTDRTISLSGGITYGVPSLNVDGEYELFPARELSSPTSLNSLQIAGVFNRSETTSSVNTIGSIRTSRWLLDSRETFSEKPRDLAADGYYLQPQDYLSSKAFHSARKEGEYQNEYSIFGSGLNTLHGTPPPAMVYNRRIPQVSSSAELLSGEAQWETPTQASSGPFGSSYDSELSDLRSITKDHSLIPEFKISDFIEDVILSQQDNNDMRTVKNKPGWLSVTGAIYHTSSATVEVDGGFYKTYSTSDFMKYFAQVDDYLDDRDSSLFLDPTRLTLKCRAGIKFVPYKGLYPAERASQIGTIFSRGYMSSFKGSEFPDLSATEADILVDRNTLLNAKKTANLQQVIKPLMAPGVLMNSIKSGMAVDYPIFGSSADDTALSNFATAIDSQSDYFTSFDASLSALDNITGSIVVSGSTDTGLPRLKGDVSKRVTFEDLLDPERLIGQKIYDNEPHPSASIYYGNNALSHVFDYPFQFGTFDQFRTQEKLRVEKLKVTNNLDAYKLAINNFCAETANFFLQDSSLATLESDTTLVTHTLPASTTYKMRIYVRNRGQQMYDRHSAFGPPVDEGDLNKTVRTWSSVVTGKTKRKVTFGTPKHIFDSVNVSTSTEADLPAISVLKNNGSTAFAVKFYNSTKTVPDAVTSASDLSSGAAARISAAGLGTLKISSSSRTAYIDIATSTLGGSRAEFGLRQDEGSNSNTVIEDNKAYALISLIKEAFDEFKNTLSSGIKPYILQNVTSGAQEIAELNAFIPGSYPEATRYVRHSLKLIDTTAGSFSSSLAITYVNPTLVQGLFDTTNPTVFTDGSAGVSIPKLTDTANQAVTDSHEFAPFYPPYLDNGAEPYVDISYTSPGTVGTVTVQDILNKASFTYSNFKETPSNSGGSNTNYTHAMNLAASLDLNSFVAYDDGPEGSRPRSPGQRARLVIQSKWETPILDFTSVTSSVLNMTDGTVDSVTDSPWQSRTWDKYLFQTAQEPGSSMYLTSSRGMWHQFGSVIKESGKGYFLSVEDHPSQSDDNQLARLLGFTNTSVNKRQTQIGKLASSKKISEAVVAVPFWEYKVDENSPAIIKWFNLADSTVERARSFNEEAKLKLDTFLRSNADKNSRTRVKNDYDSFFNSPSGVFVLPLDLETSQTVDQDILLPAYQLRMMEKFIYPPSFDFEKNDYVSQNRLMYTFQFNAELSDEDLSRIWQNIMPGSAESGGTPRYSGIKLNTDKYGISPDVQYLSHLLHTDNFPISADERKDFISKKVRWMLFKVKMKAETDLSNVKKNSLPGIRFGNKKIDKTNIINNVDSQEFPYSFNWPYDYFSIVELVKFDAKVDFTNKGS